MSTNAPSPPGASGPLRVMLVDDHAIVREGLRALLEEETRVTIVGEAGNGDEATAMAERLKPNLVLMDLKMPGLPAPDAIRVIRAHNPSVQVLVLTSYVDDQQVQAVISAGALGYVPKSATAETLRSAIQLVLSGEIYVPPAMLRGGAPETVAARPSIPLTDRQAEVLGLLNRGLSNKAIGRELNVSERTVKAHMTAIFKSLGVSSRSQAVDYARRMSLL